MRVGRSLAAVAAVVALGVTSACTVSSTDGSSSSTTGAGGDGSTPSGTATGGTSAGVAKAQSLPTQGVTADSVVLGVAGVDADKLASLGVETDGVTSESLFTAWVQAQNDRGGVGGRQIELFFRPFLPTGEAEAEAACVELTEDQQVFLAIGILTDDTPLCFTEDHGTPYLGLWGQSAERDERSVAPFVAVEMADDRQRAAAISALLDEGAMDGKKVALYWGAADTPVVDDVVRPMLADAGVDIVSEATLDDFGGDQAATDQALDVIVERFRSSGAEVVLNVSDFGNLMVAFQRAGWAPERVLSTSAQALSAGVVAGLGIEEATLDRLLVAAPYGPTVEELRDDPGVQQCAQEYNDSDPAVPLDLATATKETLNGVATQCAAFRVFVLATEAAGEDLTPATWLAGAESLGDLDLPGYPFASLGATKHSAGDAIGVYTWDAAAGEMVPKGAAIEVRD